MTGGFNALLRHHSIGSPALGSIDQLRDRPPFQQFGTCAFQPCEDRGVFGAQPVARRRIVQQVNLAIVVAAVCIFGERAKLTAKQAVEIGTVVVLALALRHGIDIGAHVTSKLAFNSIESDIAVLDRVV